MTSSITLKLVATVLTFWEISLIWLSPDETPNTKKEAQAKDQSAASVQNLHGTD